MEEEKIAWRSDTKLEWKDFKGKPNKASGNAAMTDSGYGFETSELAEDSIKLTVVNFFYPKSSWVKLDIATPKLLAHEQCHFDITEMFTRKIRKQLLGSKFSRATLKSKLEKLFNKNQEQWKEFQEKYDSETEHSKIEKKQLEWQKKVQKELNELDSFSNSELSVYVRH
ncbi:MAG: DUF922 domain-containing protein [Bacteroidota bacterium]